jgi:hypothetical protein
MVLITSGSGELGHPTTPIERTPGSPSSGTQPSRIKDPPVSSIGNNVPKAKGTPGSGYIKDLEDGSGSVKEPEVFWAVSHLTRLKEKKLENHGYILESDIGIFDIHGYISIPEDVNLTF